MGTPLYNQRYLTCELSFLSCMTRKVKVVTFKILTVLARSPINPWNIEHVPWPWRNNIPKCELCLAWASQREIVRRVTLNAGKKIKLVKKKKTYFINMRRRFDQKSLMPFDDHIILISVSPWRNTLNDPEVGGIRKWFCWIPLEIDY